MRFVLIPAFLLTTLCTSAGAQSSWEQQPGSWLPMNRGRGHRPAWLSPAELHAYYASLQKMIAVMQQNPAIGSPTGFDVRIEGAIGSTSPYKGNLKDEPSHGPSYSNPTGQGGRCQAGEINRELTALKRMFGLAIQAGRLVRKPLFPVLPALAPEDKQRATSDWIARLRAAHSLRHAFKGELEAALRGSCLPPPLA